MIDLDISKNSLLPASVFASGPDFLQHPDGVTADDSQRQYWCFKDGNGDDLTVGVDSAPIADGDAFQIVLTTY